MIDLLKRSWASFHPNELPKHENALRVGLLGASDIAPVALITPAKTHADVIIAAVAARDQKRARDYAKKYNIPTVHSSYQALLDDPKIDAVYIPLPNGLHYEWTMRALKAGKHVLLEKPSTSNATEAKKLFLDNTYLKPSIESEGIEKAPPVLLEAVHNRFHPAFQKFLSLLDKPNIKEVHTTHHFPKGYFQPDNIRFNYDLAGGSLMDFGYYNVQLLRQVFGAEPEECIETDVRLAQNGRGDQRIDEAFSAKWRFPNGGVGSIEADLVATGGSWLTSWMPAIRCPMCEVKHREVIVAENGLDGKEHVKMRTVTFWNSTMPSFWHRIDVVDEHTVRNVADGKVEKQSVEKEYVKAYKGEVGDALWTSYRHQLEQFVNKVRGRESTGTWIEGEDSVKQMEMIDSAYRKAGLPIRPGRTYGES